MKFNDIKEYNLWRNGIGRNGEEVRRLVYDFYDSVEFDSIQLIEGAKETIEKLSLGRVVYVITTRLIRLRGKTEKFFQKFFRGKIRDVVYSGDFCREQGPKKGEIYKRLGALGIVEDNLKCVVDCAESGTRVFLFDKPWNQESVNGGIVRVLGWNNILQILESEK